MSFYPVPKSVSNYSAFCDRSLVGEIELPNPRSIGHLISGVAQCI